MGVPVLHDNKLMENPSSTATTGPLSTSSPSRRRTKTNKNNGKPGSTNNKRNNRSKAAGFRSKNSKNNDKNHNDCPALITLSDSYTSCESSSCESSSCESEPSRASRRSNDEKQQKQQRGSKKKNNYNSNKNSRCTKRKQQPKRNQSSNNNLNEATPEEQKQYIALDCEMVGVGIDGRQSIVARVTMIDWDCNIVYDKFVKPTREITDYRTFVSGITPEALREDNDLLREEQNDESSSTTSITTNHDDDDNEQAIAPSSSSRREDLVDIETCRAEVLEIIHDKVLIGHALKNDLHALNITHPWYQIRDTAKYEPFMKVRFNDGILWPRKLKELVQEKLHYDIQTPGKPHSAYEDAKAALDLYRRVRYKWEKAMTYKINKTKQIQEQKQHQQEQRQQQTTVTITNDVVINTVPAPVVISSSSEDEYSSCSSALGLN